MRKLEYLKIDILYPLWNFYHKWFLHKGKINWLTSCDHYNPYDILTPHRFDVQCKNIMRMIEKGEN